MTKTFTATALSSSKLAPTTFCSQLNKIKTATTPTVLMIRIFSIISLDKMDAFGDLGGHFIMSFPFGSNINIIPSANAVVIFTHRI